MGIAIDRGALTIEALSITSASMLKETGFASLSFITAVRLIEKNAPLLFVIWVHIFLRNVVVKMAVVVGTSMGLAGQLTVDCAIMGVRVGSSPFWDRLPHVMTVKISVVHL